MDCPPDVVVRSRILSEAFRTDRRQYPGNVLNPADRNLQTRSVPRRIHMRRSTRGHGKRPAVPFGLQSRSHRRRTMTAPALEQGLSVIVPVYSEEILQPTR